MAQGWESVTKPAMKILGDKGKIPTMSPNVAKLRDAGNKAFDEFSKARDDLKNKLLLLQNADAAHKNAVTQFQDMIDADDLGLDRKNKDDAKKIADARKLLSGYIQDALDDADENLKNLRALDKHLMSLSNYTKESSG